MGGAVGPARLLALKLLVLFTLPHAVCAQELSPLLMLLPPPTVDNLWRLGLLVLLALSLVGLVSMRRRLARQAEASQQAAKSRLLARFADAALEDAEVGRWVWDLRNEKVAFSKGWIKMMRLDPEDVDGDVNDWFQRVHPNYLGEVKDAIAAHLDGKNPRFECDYRIQRGDGTYLWVLSRAVAHRGADGEPEFLAGAQIDITAVVDVEKRVLHDAYIDKLTGLPNRRAFTSILERACSDSEDEGFHFAVVFIDLDRFKQVNDSLGHAVGDELLAAVAARLNRQRRSGDTVARLGGDEFVALLGDISEPRQAFDAGRRIHGALSEPFQLGRHEVLSGGSVGIAVSPGGHCDPEIIIRQADQAMYQAKTSRKGVVLFCENMRGEASRVLTMQTELTQATERAEMQLYFQPIVELATGRIVAAEALLRWIRSSGESVRAAEFMPLAEELGILGDLSELALRMACTQRAAWLARGFRDFRVGVNIGALQLQRRDFAAHVENVLAQTSLEPRLLDVEVTESALIDSLHVAPASLERLDSMGVGLTLDDFGVGYASLAYLQRFPFRSIKVDPTMLVGLEENPKMDRNVRGIVSMARSMGLCIVAEGVESPTDLQMIREIGFDQAQGYCLGRPMPIDELTRLLEGEAKMRRPSGLKQPLFTSTS